MWILYSTLHHYFRWVYYHKWINPIGTTFNWPTSKWRIKIFILLVSSMIEFGLSLILAYICPEKLSFYAVPLCNEFADKFTIFWNSLNYFSRVYLSTVKNIAPIFFVQKHVLIWSYTTQIYSKHFKLKH